MAGKVNNVIKRKVKKSVAVIGSDTERTPRIKDRLKVEILKAAKELLSEGKDVRLITMQLLAKRMDLTAPTLYHYFKGKEEIIIESLELICDELLETFDMPLPASLTQDMKLKIRIINLMTYLHKNLNSFSLVFSDSGIGVWGNDSVNITDKVKQFRALLEQQVGDYLAAEKIKYPPNRAAHLLLALIMGSLRYQKSEKPKNVDIAKECETVFSFFHNGLKKSL